MNKQEKIVCAAIKLWIGDVEQIDLYVHYPDNFTESRVSVGSVGYVKGFITNKNRFVDPIEATEIAYFAGQLSRTIVEGVALKPSDLY